MSALNYRAWEISLADFKSSASLYEKLKFLAGYAVLAPSSHNTQPWKFSINEDSLVVKADFSRKLEASDPLGRELYISLGCCIENLIIALDAFKVDYFTEFFPDGIDSPSILRIKIKKENFDISAASSSPLLQAITRRHSNRSPHLLSLEDYKQLKILVKEFQRNSVSLYLTMDREKMLKLGELVSEGTRQAFSNNKFRGELSCWVRNNYTRSPLGMPGFTMDIPGSLSIFLPKIISKIQPGRRSLEEERTLLVEKTQTIGVLLVKKESPLSWIEGGRILENFILKATLLGFGTSFHTAPIEIGGLYKGMQELLNTESRPIALIRIGRNSKYARMTPRLRIEECLIFDQV